jgi:hypothetical protein
MRAPFVILWIIIFWAASARAQNKLFMNPIKYTDRQLSLYQSGCTTSSKIHLTVNGTPIYPSRTLFITGGYWAFEIEFGQIKPGDIFKVTDDCAGTPFEQIVKDDYVYVEVAAGNGHPGNGIGPNDEYAPYSKLSTPVQIGKCAPLTIDSHGLVNYFIFSPKTGGKFSVNGSPLTNGATTINPGGYDINFNGFPGTPFYTINADGSITTNATVKMESNTHYSGQIPIVLEYQHNGIEPPNDLSFGFKAMTIRHVGNTGCGVEKASLGGAIITTNRVGTPTSKYKVTYDGVYYRAYVDDILVDELRRFVEYDASSGTLTPGSSAGLDYSTPVNWTGTASGQQWVSVLIDGVLFTKQLFTVADDIKVDATSVEVACTDGSSGKIVVGVSGGLPPFQYALNAGAYQLSNQFNNLAAGSYTVRVRDASGCTGTDIVTIGNPVAVSLSVVSKTDVTCSGSLDGSVTLQAAGGTGSYVFSKDGSFFINTPAFTALTPGLYTFSAKDQNGCTATVTETIQTTSIITASVTTLQPATCFGTQTGTFSISTTGSTLNGTPKYSKDNGGTFQDSNVFSGLAAGTYQIVVKDNSCSISLSSTITQPGALEIAANTSGAVTCHGLNDGVITSSGQSGTSPYQYSIDGTQYSASTTFSGLSAGNYKIWIKDANGCTKESPILSVSQPTVLAASIFSKTDVTCYNGHSGQLVLSASGGTVPYTYSKDNTNYQQLSSFTGLGAGPLTLTVKDANGCTVTVTGEIIQPTDIIVTPSIASHVSCYGGANGAIQVASSGGTGLIRHSLDGTTFNNINTFSGLTAGSYQVTARDNNGCTKVSLRVDVTQATQIMPVAVVTNVKCFGGQDGVVALSATGGTSAYSYSKDGTNYQSAAIFGGLSIGTYTLSVKDANHCVRPLEATISQPTDLVVGLSIEQQVLCYNGNSGTLVTSATGGIAPYQYSMNGVSYQPSASFASLTIGTYKIWIKDTNGCIKETGEKTIVQPAELLTSVVNQVAVKCHNGSDGTVELAASGGTSPYIFSRDGANFQSSTLFSGLAASTISFTVKDAHGCIKANSVQIQQPAQPYVISLAASTNLTCHQENTGRIEIQNNGGTAPYQISVDNNHYQSSPVFSNLASGTYSIYGKDANSCVFTLSTVTLSQPTPIRVSLRMKKDVDCEYYTKGEALVAADGSNGDFTYTLSGTDFKFKPIAPQSNAAGLFQNLSAGDYTVTARDQAGCSKDFVVTIIPKSTNIRYDVSKTFPSTCTSEDGTIRILNATGGRPPYQYSISSQNSFSSNANFPGLLNGGYIVTVSDELCSYKKEVDLTLPGAIKAAYTIEPVNCETPVANLNITQITGGSGSYTLSLNGSPFSSNQQFTNLHPNIYSLTVQDSPFSCKSVTSVEIKEQNRADLQVESRQDVHCYRGSSGFIQIKGDNNMGPFTYAINNGPFGIDGMFANLSTGNYRLYAKNRMGCFDSIRVTLVQPTALTGSFTKKDNDCFGDRTGGLALFAGGGTPGYTYSIDGSDYASSNTFDSLNAKNYTGFIKDTHGCIVTQNIAVIQPPLLTLTPAYQDTVRCFGESNGIVNVTATGGTPAYQYSINGTDYLADSRFGNLQEGYYKFYVRDINGCIKNGDLTLIQPSALQISLASKTDPLCFDGVDGVITVASQGGNGGNTYTLDNNVSQPQNEFRGLTQAGYSIKVTDRKGCSADLPAVALQWPEKISSSYTTTQPKCFGEASGTLTISVSGGTPGYQSLFDGKTYDPVNGQFVFQQVKSATWPVEIRDQHGCVDVVQVLMEQPTILQESVVISNNKCFNDQTGKIEVTGQGATPAYSYSLDNNGYSQSGVFSGLKSGAYVVRVKDAAGCVLSRDIEVIQPTQVQLTAVNNEAIRCYGESNGSVRILASGGTPLYSYSTNGFDFYSDSTFRNMKAGNYRFWIKDRNLCENTTILAITEPPVLNLSLTDRSNPLCAGDQNGRIVINATGGNGGYVYWKDNSTEQVTGVFGGLTQSDYTFKAIDRKGCEDTLKSVALTWPKPLASKASWKQPTCSNDKDAAVTISLNGGVSPYSITSPGLAAPTADGPASWKYSNLDAGFYTFTSTDANGCKAFSSVTISPTAKFNTVQFPTPEPVCTGQEVILTANNPGQDIRWFFNGQESAYYGKQQVITAVDPGEYKLVISNQTGCSASYSYRLVNNNNALKADFLMTIQAFVGDTVKVLDISRPTPDDLKWELPPEAQKVISDHSSISFSTISDGTFPVKMTARKGDCVNTKIRTIQIFRKEDIALTDSTLHYQDINLVQEMIVFPNPNFGKFTVTVKLAKVSDATLTITRASSNAVIYLDQKKKEKEYVFGLDLKGFLQDVYIITIQAGKSVLFKRALLMN